MAGYPTVLALSPGRSELARIAGGMDASVYANMLDLVLGDVRPIADLLRAAAERRAALSSDDCARLAYNGWGLDDYPTAEDERRIAAELFAARSSCPAEARSERARLTVIAAGYYGDALHETVSRPDAVDASVRGAIQEAEQIIADRELAASMADALQYLGEGFFELTEHVTPERIGPLEKNWGAVMDAAASDGGYSEGDRIAALEGKLTAIKTLSGKIPAELAADARKRLGAAFARVGDSDERAGLVNAAINLLGTLDDPAAAYAIAEQEMKTSKTPYYYMSDMAYLDEKLGRRDAAIHWYERAYHEARGPATRFEWGTDYVRALVRLSPESDSAVRTAAIEVLGELQGPDRIYRRSQTRLQRLDASLEAWNKGGGHAASIEAIRARMAEICAGISAAGDAKALASCQAFLTPASSR